MRFGEEFLSELRFRNPIDEVVSSYVELKQSGSLMKGLCPFHNEKTASFTVYPNNGSYYCFGCQNGGDVITFIRSIENLDYVEAVKYLADRCGLPMPSDGYDDSAEKLRRTLLEINRETARFYHSCLRDKNIGARGRAYFRERRLADSTITHFGLGFAPDSGFSLCNHLKSKGYSEPDMILANVAGKGRSGRAYDRFRGKVMFPIIDLRGNVIAFGGRKLPGDEGAKYINTSDTPVYKKSRNMYAMNFAKNSKSDSIILCEGYMDVIALHQAGFTNAVAALGTSFTDEQAALLSRYAKEVIITMDSDEAGKRAAERAIRIINRTGLKVRVLNIDGGKDPDEYIKTYGAERFRMLLDGAKNDIEFHLNAARDKYDTDSDAGKLEYATEAVDILAALNNEIAENLYAGRLADELSVDKAVLLNRIKLRREQKNRYRVKKQLREMTAPKKSLTEVNPEARQHRRAAAAEEGILTIIMNNPELCGETFEKLTSDKFVTSFNRQIYEQLCRIMKKDNDFNISMISGDFSPDQMGKISEIYNNQTVNSNPKSTLDDCIKALVEEKEKLNPIDTANMSDDDFAQALERIKRGKTGGR